MLNDDSLNHLDALLMEQSDEDGMLFSAFGGLHADLVLFMR